MCWKIQTLGHNIFNAVLIKPALSGSMKQAYVRLVTSAVNQKSGKEPQCPTYSAKVLATSGRSHCLKLCTQVGFYKNSMVFANQ